MDDKKRKLFIEMVQRAAQDNPDLSTKEICQIIASRIEVDAGLIEEYVFDECANEKKCGAAAGILKHIQGDPTITDEESRDDGIEDCEMEKEYDFSKGKRGMFYIENSEDLELAKRSLNTASSKKKLADLKNDLGLDEAADIRDRTGKQSPKA